MKLRSLVALFVVSADAGLLAGTQGSPSGAPELILVGGRVHALDPARPWAEAVAVRGDRIVGVGTSAEMRMSALANRRANTVRTFRSSSAVPSGDGKIHAGIGSPFFSQRTTHDARPTARGRGSVDSRLVS